MLQTGKHRGEKQNRAAKHQNKTKHQTQDCCPAGQHQLSDGSDFLSLKQKNLIFHVYSKIVVIH